MQGDPEIITLLNEQLTSELTAINQYFLHAKMQENWGYTKLAAHTRAESIEEMTHAERLTDRILFLEGLPNYQKLLDQGDARSVGDILAAGSEASIEKRLRSFADAGTTDVSVRVVPIGADREEKLASSRRTRDYLASLAGSL